MSFPLSSQNWDGDLKTPRPSSYLLVYGRPGNHSLIACEYLHILKNCKHVERPLRPLFQIRFGKEHQN